MPDEVSGLSLDLRVVDVRRSPPTGVRAKEHMAVLDTVDAQYRLIVRQAGTREARLLALVLTGGDAEAALQQGLAEGWLRTLGGTIRELRITSVADGVYTAEATVEDASGIQTVEARLWDLLPQAAVAGGAGGRALGARRHGRPA